MGLLEGGRAIVTGCNRNADTLGSSLLHQRQGLSIPRVPHILFATVKTNAYDTDDIVIQCASDRVINAAHI